MMERSPTDPEISRQLCSRGMVDYMILLRLKKGKVTFYLLPVVKRKKEVLFKLPRLEEMKVELDRIRQQLV